MLRKFWNPTRHRALPCAALLLIFLMGSAHAWAHIGPPYPILEKQQVGPLSVDVWGNPDVGVGSFFVILNPPLGVSVPPDIKVRVVVQPVSKRLPEATFDTWRESLKDRIEYKTVVPFDKEETWKVRVLLKSSQFSGETDTEVPVTPGLMGRWDLLLFLLPFLGIGFVWFKAMRAKSKMRKNMRAKQKRAETA